MEFHRKVDSMYEIPSASIKCACGSTFDSYLEFSKHIIALDNFDLASTNDWLRRQAEITQHEMDKRGL